MIIFPYARLRVFAARACIITRNYRTSAILRGTQETRYIPSYICNVDGLTYIPKRMILYKHVDTLFFFFPLRIRLRVFDFLSGESIHRGEVSR